MKTLLLSLMLFGAGVAQAEPAPVLPQSPTLPDTTPTKVGIVGNDVIRPTSSANADVYKKVPLDKAKIGGYLKKMPKGGFLELGLIVGITALSEAVDYLIDEAGTVRYTNYTWFISPNGVEQTFTSLPDACRAWIAVNNMSYIYTNSTVSMIQTAYGYAVPLGNCFYQRVNGGGGYFNVSVKRDSKKDNEIPLDEIANKIIDAGKKGNPNAVRLINDWADDEIKRNPNAYPDTVPQPSPQPNPATNPNNDPATVPSPVPVPAPNPSTTPSPNPADNPNALPRPNPAGDPNAPTSPTDDPAISPNPSPNPATSPNPDGTQNPNEQTFKFELPAFCSWAGVVCDFIDWVKKDDTDKDNEFELEQDLTPDIDTDIKFSGQCPADVVISGTIFGQVISFTFFEWSKFCGFLAMLKPIIIALASYQAVRIVGGVNVAD